MADAIVRKVEGRRHVVVPAGAETLNRYVDAAAAIRDEAQAARDAAAAHLADFPNYYKGDKGDPGGNVMATGPFAALAGLSIPAGTDLIHTSGYTSAGDGGDAFYRVGSVIDADSSLPARAWTRDSVGRLIVLADAELSVIRPEALGAVGDASVQYDGGGVAIGYAGTDDTAAAVAAFNIAKARRGKLKLSKWYRLTAPLGTMDTPFSITGPGRFQAGFVYDPTATGACITVYECWMGRDKDEITTGMVVRDPAQLYSGARLEGFSIVGDRNTANPQSGLVFARRNDKAHVHDVGVYHLKGCGLDMGYDDRVVGTRKAAIRECDIHVEVKWCGDAANGIEAIRYVSEGWQTGDDSSNNNSFDVECFFSDGKALLIENRNTTGNIIRFDQWNRLMVEGGGDDIITVSGNVAFCDFRGVEWNSFAAGSYGLVLQEFAGHTTASAGGDRMPRHLTFSGSNQGRAGTHGIHAVACKNITFDNMKPSAFRAQGGADFHLVVEATVSGVIEVKGAASAGYTWNISCADAALIYLRVDPGRMEASSASVPLSKSMAHSFTYVPDAFPGNTPGMTFSTGSKVVIWPVSTRDFRSNDAPVAAGSAQYRVPDMQVVGTDTTAAKLSIYNTLDGSYRLDWFTRLAAARGQLPYLSAQSPDMSGGSGAIMSPLPDGQVQFDRGIKLTTPAANPVQRGSLYAETLGALRPLTYQDGAYASRQHMTWNSAAPVDGTWKQGDIVWNTGAAAGGKAGWICTVAGTPGTWKAFGAIDA